MLRAEQLFITIIIFIDDTVVFEQTQDNRYRG